MAESLLPRARSTPQTRTGARQRQRANGLLVLASMPLLLFLLVPLGALLLRIPLADLLARVSTPQVAQAVSLSIVTTLTTTLITVLAGTPLAYLLARRQFRGRAALDTLLDLPMVLPPSVAGIALLIAFGRQGLVGSYLDAIGISIAFSTTAVVLAQLFVAAPYFVKAAITGFVGVERELEQSAALDGAGPSQVFRLITLPLAWPALLSGAVMTWARAVGEFGATIIFAGNLPGRTQTMPLAIYIGFEIDLQIALTLACILLATSFGVLFVVKGALRQRV